MPNSYKMTNPFKQQFSNKKSLKKKISLRMFKKLFIITSWLLLATSEPIEDILVDQPIGCQIQVTNGFDIAFEKIGTYSRSSNY